MVFILMGCSAYDRMAVDLTHSFRQQVNPAYVPAMPSSSTSTKKERELQLVVVQLREKITNLESKHQKEMDHFRTMLQVLMKASPTGLQENPEDPHPPLYAKIICRESTW
ncbi:hypothetical protein SLA2020_273550 [Shorea laevis]